MKPRMIEFSYHMQQMQKLIDVIEELLSGGAHEGNCAGEDDPGYTGPCWKHVEASDAREKKARAIVDTWNFDPKKVEVSE